MEKQNAHKGHRQRLRERYFKEGLDSFQDHEILELLLFAGRPYCDTNETAHRLIERFGTLCNVLEAEPEDLMQVEGVGVVSATLIRMIPELAARYMRQKWGDHPCLTSTALAGEYSSTLCGLKTHETFYLVCLDAGGRVICPVLISEGSITEVSIYPRMVVEAALRHKAARVLLVHNHPSGRLTPSSEDVRLTDAICKTLAPISIAVSDHLVVSGERFYSFREHGLMPNEDWDMTR